MVTMKSPLPLGLLQFEVLEGRNLPAADTGITGKKSSDPFVSIKVGFGVVRSSTAENTLNPKWKDPPGHLFVYNVAQLVRITVHDDDVMGADVLGTVVGYNVFLLCREAEKAQKDGLWLSLQDGQGNPAGQLRIIVRYFDVADLGKLPPAQKAPDPSAPPYLLTVKLLGLEAEDRGDLRNTRATVEIVHPVDKAKEAVDHKSHHANRLMHGLEGAMTWMTTKVKAATGLGFGHRHDGVPAKRKSGKAVLWGGCQLEDKNRKVIPPMAVRAMEKLHIREGWPIEKVAAMFQLDPEVVTTAVHMRGNFEVVWHEALHFLQPASDPFLGKVAIKVEAPSINQVRGADDHGFIGEFEVDLSPDAEETRGDNNSSHRRRVRRMLYRAKKSGSKKTASEDIDIFSQTDSQAISHQGSQGEQGEGSHDNEECTGILIELVVELRYLETTKCQLDEGQTLRNRKSIVAASELSGVRMIPE